MKVPTLSLFAASAIAVVAEEIGNQRELNVLRDNTFFTYGELAPRPLASYHVRSDWAHNHGSHLDMNSASTGLPLVSAELPVRPECWFAGGNRLRGPVYAENDFWRAGDHGLRAWRFEHLNRVAPPAAELYRTVEPTLAVDEYAAGHPFATVGAATFGPATYGPATFGLGGLVRYPGPVPPAGAVHTGAWAGETDATTGVYNGGRGWINSRY